MTRDEELEKAAEEWEGINPVAAFRGGTEWEAERAKVLVEALEQVKDHCLCERNTYGFDYGEKHKRLGKPEGGKRWLQPFDIINQALKHYQGEGNG